MPSRALRLRGEVSKVQKQCSLWIQVIRVSFDWIELKSLILAQIERWRNALHMQVERQRGATWRRAANG